MLLWPTPLLPLCRGVWKAVPFASQLFVGFFSSALKYLVLLYFHNNHNHTHPPPTPHSTTTDVCSKRKWRHWYNQGLVRVLSYQILQQIRNNNQKKKNPPQPLMELIWGPWLFGVLKVCILHFVFECIGLYLSNCCVIFPSVWGCECETNKLKLTGPLSPNLVPLSL